MKENLKDSDFNEVLAGSLVEFPCSPELDLDSIGILINAPETVEILKESKRDMISEAFANMVVCGAYNLKPEQIKHGAPDDFTIVAVNDRTGTSYTTKLNQIDYGISENPVDEPDPEGDAWSTPGMEVESVGGYFNPNLALIGIPDIPETYSVHVEYSMGSEIMKSNMLKIKLVEK